MIAFLLNLALAAIWLMLSKAPTLMSFFIGFVLSYFLIAIFSKLIGKTSYTRRSMQLFRFVILFFFEFVSANLDVAYLILFIPSAKIEPGFFALDVSDLTDTEALLLAHCITLTPGTITVDFLKEERRELIVHCLNNKELSVAKHTIEKKFKNGILRFSR